MGDVTVDRNSGSFAAGAWIKKGCMTQVKRHMEDMQACLPYHYRTTETGSKHVLYSAVEEDGIANYTLFDEM